MKHNWFDLICMYCFKYKANWYIFPGNISKITVMSGKVKKKQHVHIFKPAQPLQCVLFTYSRALIFINTVTKPS